MAGSLNKVILIGNLARDPEVRQGADGNKIVTFPVATSEQWRDKATGERKERAEFHRVVIFNERLADITERYLKKGNKVYLEGQLTTRKWVDNSGQERYVTEVVLARYRGELLLLGGKNAPAGDGGDSASSAEVPADRDAIEKALGDLDDEVPF
jgi:single-strand DNA-binding protein